MQLDYGSTSPPRQTAASGERGRTRTAGMTLDDLASNAGVSKDHPTSLVHSDDTHMVGLAQPAASAASRILDELLGDMLVILEEEESEDDDDASSSTICSSSPSDSEDIPQVSSKVTSPVPNDKEEGELESEEELRLKEERRLQALAEAESRKARRLEREEKEKTSVERSLSQRDVFRYLKKNGECVLVGRLFATRRTQLLVKARVRMRMIVLQFHNPYTC